MTLHLLQVPIDIHRLLENADDRTVRFKALDLGYHVHGWLTRSIGKGVIKPFALRERALLGYSELGAAAVTARLHQFAPPNEHAVVRGEIASKPMPPFGAGVRVDVDVRVAPTVRLASAAGNIPKGGEVDAWIAHRERHGDDGTTREAVYRAWFERCVEREAFASIERLELTQLKRTRVLRRDHGPQRKARTFELPEVTFSATVTTGPGFDALLARGLGRHRSFGFGMLLLRPPSC